MIYITKREIQKVIKKSKERMESDINHAVQCKYNNRIKYNAYKEYRVKIEILLNLNLITTAKYKELDIEANKYYTAAID